MATSKEEVVAFCEIPCPDGEDHTDSSRPPPPGVSNAVVWAEKIWKSRQVLYVYFINPEVLTEWGLTTDTILEWAGAWGDVMVFQERKKAEKADIRVEFSETRGSWSMVGMSAESVSVPKPTMVLNLSKNLKHCPDTQVQRSLVIHEFGHALGLEHEHQRSDFWECVERYIDMEKMKDDDRVGSHVSREGKASFGEGWFKDKSKLPKVIKKIFGIKDREDGQVVSEYDPDSIMHYGFDLDWLKSEKHRDFRWVKETSELNEKEKKYIKGIHQRRGSLARNPSVTDLAELRKAYKRPPPW